jgi:peptidase E
LFNASADIVDHLQKKELFLQFTESSGRKAIFIPTASLPEKVTFYIDADKKHWKNLI